MENQKQPGFQLLVVALTESNFKRAEQIDFSKPLQPKVGINTGYSIDSETKLVCTLEVKYDAEIEGVKVIESIIKYVALFEIVGIPEIEIDKFGKINAPSIIFPFIREHLASLSSKAGINTILLPPFNFVALANQQK